MTISMKLEAASLAALVITMATAARAQADEPPPATGDGAAERAQLLFDRALELSRSGHDREACPMLEESLRLDPAMGTRYRLAECYEMTNRRVDAFRLYREVEDAARQAGMGERERLAKQRGDAIAAMLAPLVLWVPPEVATTKDLAVSLDGHEIERGAWVGEALMVDLGEHVLEAVAPGREPYRRVVPVREGSERVEVSIPSLRREGEAPRSPIPPTRVAPKAPVEPTSMPHATALVLGISGASAIVVGLGIGAASMATSGLSDGTRATAGFGIGLGALGLAAAGISWLSSPEKPRKDAGFVTIVPGAGPLGGGISLVGRF